MGTEKGPGRTTHCDLVVIETPSTIEAKEVEGDKGKPAADPKPAVDPDAVMKAMDGFRKKLPEPQGLNEQNGLGVADIDGNSHPDSHLAGIASRLGVKTRAECIVLMTYLKDPDRRFADRGVRHRGRGQGVTRTGCRRRTCRRWTRTGTARW